MCDTKAEGGRRCPACKDTALQTRARAERRRRARLRSDALVRMGHIAEDSFFDETRSTDAAARAAERHDRWLAMLRADTTDPAVAKLRFDRPHNADITDPARAWVAEALAAGAASGDLNETAVRAAFEDENPDVLARSAFAQVYEHVAGRTQEEAVAA